MAASAGLRKVAAWLPAVVVVPAVMAGAVQVARPTEQLAELRDLLPMEVGTTWVYDVFADGEPSGTRTRQVTGQAAVSVDILDAVTVSSVYTDYPGSGPYSDLLYLGLEGDSLDQLGVFVNHEHLAVDPPAPAYELPLTAGHAWSYQGTVGTARLRYDAELEAIEDVEVGGRTFTGCSHFVTLLQLALRRREGVRARGGGGGVDLPGVRAGPEQQRRRQHRDPGDRGARRVPRGERQLVRRAPGGGRRRGARRRHRRPRCRGGATRSTASSADRLAWTDGRSARFDFPPVADDDVMVLVERDGEVSAMDVTTGEMRWRVRLAKPIVATPDAWPATGCWWPTGGATSGRSRWRTGPPAGSASSTTW